MKRRFQLIAEIRGAGESFLFESVRRRRTFGTLFSCRVQSARAVIRQTENRVEVFGEWKSHRDVFHRQRREGRPRRRRARDEKISRSIAAGSAAIHRRRGRFPYRLRIHPRRNEPVVPLRPPQDELKTPVMVFLVADQLLIFDRRRADSNHRSGQRISSTRRPIPPTPTKTPSAKSNGSCHCSNSRANTSPSACRMKSPKSRSHRTSRAKKVLRERPRRQKNSSRRATSSRSSARNAFPRRLRRRRWTFMRAVRSINPSPYMFLLELDGFSLVGASPEVHVRCEEGRVEIRPIAGTRPRGKNSDEDSTLEKNCSPTRRNAPNTSCSWTSHATTSGACAILVPRAGERT